MREKFALSLQSNCFTLPLTKNAFNEEEMKENLTMKDIARELGISVATVSRALNNSTRISAAQRQRIQQYAREHNFTPNVLAESLRHSRVKPVKIIGVIVP